ncbi:MAG: lysophospholipid acyltransferase family protein [Rikenellaceae bacterium]|jgi:KDO2-lipid IV(A) lauroyltransferase|nr:lysophospholipid acyltransferase family protein [Rikenellaceae bacterium]
MKKAWVAIRYRILRCGSQAMGLLPHWFLYGPLRMTLYFFINKVTGYRTRVVRENLRNSFPEKSAAELKTIECEFYRHLAELFVDTIDLTSISHRALLRRVTITNLAEHEARVAGQDWIAAMSHFGSWEYFSAYQLCTAAQIVGVYHPLENPAFDQFFRWMRSRTGMKAVSSRMLLRYIVEHRKVGDGNIAVGMIADQLPLPFGSHSGFWFLHQPTVFYEGMETVARRFAMPVYFLHLRKVGVAKYEGRFEPVWDGVSPVEEYQITARYVCLLEDQIREQPAYWLWSHRRWKRGPNPGVPVTDPRKWQ